MKLHEEFKTYENLWEELDPVDELLNTYDDFEFAYEGFDEEGYEDRFDPGSAHGHFQTSKKSSYDDYTYTVDAVSVFETLRDSILSKNADKISNADLAAEYKRLNTAWENSTEETEDAAGDALDLFLAKNLEELANDFYYDLKNYYEDEALEWANDNW